MPGLVLRVYYMDLRHPPNRWGSGDAACPHSTGTDSWATLCCCQLECGSALIGSAAVGPPPGLSGAAGRPALSSGWLEGSFIQSMMHPRSHGHSWQKSLRGQQRMQ